MFGLKRKELEEIKAILRQEGISRAIVFGSRAMGNYRPGSDVDLAVIGDEKRLSYALNEESSLIYHFDVLNLEKIHSDKLKSHIERVGKLLT